MINRIEPMVILGFGIVYLIGRVIIQWERSLGEVSLAIRDEIEAGDENMKESLAEAIVQEHPEVGKHLGDSFGTQGEYEISLQKQMDLSFGEEYLEDSLLLFKRELVKYYLIERIKDVSQLVLGSLFNIIPLVPLFLGASFTYFLLTLFMVMLIQALAVHHSLISDNSSLSNGESVRDNISIGVIRTYTIAIVLMSKLYLVGLWAILLLSPK